MAEKFNPLDRIKLTYKNKIYEGIVMPRAENSTCSFLTLKLDSGYDIGLKLDEISDINLVPKDPKTEVYESNEVPVNNDLPTISILATGGTIASRVDYLTGGVHSAFTASEIISTVPEISNISNVRGSQIFNKFSENLCPKDWIKIAKAVYKELDSGVDGVVITHGTDTMGYSAAALSFMLKTPVPVVFTGAQRSSDRGSSDASQNLLHASQVAATADLGGVCVLMHEKSDDISSTIHSGTHARKLHSSKRDAFKSVNANPWGLVNPSRIILDENAPKRGGELALDTSLDESVSIIKYYPGMDSNLFEKMLKSSKGAIIEGTGLGHVSEDAFESVKNALNAGTQIYMCTQTINGRVNMNVYSTGRKLLEIGVISCEDMLSETAYVKLMWALAKESEPEKVSHIMKSNICGEYSLRLPL